MNIKLYNRYKEHNYLKHVEGDKWELVLGNKNNWNYVRVIRQEGEHEIDDNNLYAVDPPGGPFISVGSEISGMIVYKITSEEPGYIVYLKEKEKEEEENEQ